MLTKIGILPQPFDDGIGCILGIHLHGRQSDLRILRSLIGAVDAGEVLCLADTCLFVEALHITAFGLGERGIDIDLNNAPPPPSCVPSAVRRRRAR